LGIGRTEVEGGKKTPMPEGLMQVTTGDEAPLLQLEMIPVTGTVTKEGTMGGTALTETRGVAEGSQAMNLLGREMAVRGMEASLGIEMEEEEVVEVFLEIEIATPEILVEKEKLLRKDPSYLWLPDLKPRKMKKVELLSQAFLVELSLLIL